MKTNREPPLWLLVVLVGFPQISETIFTPSLPDVARTFGVGNDQVNLTLSIYFIGFGLGVLLWGRLSDRVGRRRAMLGGIALYALGCLSCYFCGTLTSLVASRFIQAFGASAGSVVTQTMMRDLFSGQRRAQVFSIITGSIAFAPALGPFIGGFVDQWWGFHANFMLLFGLGLCLLAYCGARLPETLGEAPRRQSVSMSSLALQMVRDPHVWRCVLVVGGTNGVLFSYYSEAPFLFIELLGFTPGEYGLFGVFIALTTLGASMLSHRLSAFVSSWRVVQLGLALMLLGSLCLMLCASQGYIHLGSRWAVLWLVLPMTLVFLGMGLAIPNCLSTALRSYQQAAGSAGALFGLSYYLLIALLTELMGVFHDGSALVMPAYFSGLVCLMAASTLLGEKGSSKSLSPTAS